MRFLRPLALLGGATLLVAAACGGGGDSTTETKSTAAPAASSPAAATTAPGTAPASAAPQVFEIKAGERSGSEYFFEPNTISMRAGKVTIKLNNAGPERPHTLTVRGADGKDVAKIERTNPNSSGTVEFTLEEAGTYQFLCVLPGHADRGQKGTITVAQT